MGEGLRIDGLGCGVGDMVYLGPLLFEMAVDTAVGWLMEKMLQVDTAVDTVVDIVVLG